MNNFIFLFGIIALGLSTLLISEVLAQEKIAVTTNIDPITILTNELIPLLDTSSIGNLTAVSVTANLPCDSSNVPKLKIIAGILGNTTNVIDSSTDYTNNKGPRDTCLFTDSVTNVTEAGIPALNRVFVKNTGSTPVHIPEGVMVTLSGVFESPLLVPPQATPPTFSDDFSTNQWTHSHSDPQISGGTLNWNLNYGSNVNDHRSYYDLGSALSNQWVARFKLDVTTAGHSTSDGAKVAYFTISDTTTDWITSQDQLGIELRVYRSDTTLCGKSFHGVYSNNQAGSATRDCMDFEYSAGTYYIELDRSNADIFTVRIFSDDTFSTTSLLKSEAYNISSAYTGLRYVKLTTEIDTNANNQVHVASIDNLQIWDGVSP